MTKLQQTQPNKIVMEPLRWLFVAHFADGSKIEQDQSDECKTRADGSGSTFTDVLARESQLTAFELLHVNGKEVVTVDLRSGAFIVNGTPMHLHDQYFPAEKHELRLVYFRETRVDTEMLGTVLEGGGVASEVVGTPRHYVNRYFIGWQTTVNGKNKQVTMAVG